ncbi:MAG: M23 family metallopeptidase [Cyclobacteriaceae bacterium]|nr:M23 family metallopeptidase [Cytophagales bacterium]MBX2898720.1 M23 family metallopeptidase [Cyclobacteriaceae bacterium]
MARMRYTYNEQTCKYDPIVVSPKAAARHVLHFLIISFCLGVAGLVYFNANYPHLDETLLADHNQELKAEWQVLYKQLGRTSDQLSALEHNDDHNYRVILDLEPLDLTQREAGVGGRAKASESILYPVIRIAYDKAEKLKNRLDIEAQSLNQLKEELEKKEKMWASRPAIQPVSNKDLKQLHTLFGLRLHPLLGYVRPHNGLDFTAPTGAPIYATGDGSVNLAQYSETLGNMVFIDHGYGLQTRYGHMTRFIVSAGEKVKRGQVIGYVGNTGTSVGPHLHYEVLYHGTYVNPINFFQRDLKNQEYEKLIEIGSQSVTSLD